jgi:hypothetical protein
MDSLMRLLMALHCLTGEIRTPARQSRPKAAGELLKLATINRAFEGAHALLSQLPHHEAGTGSTSPT